MTRVKICGVTSLEDACMCAELGADFIGNIVGIPSSPRNISIDRSKRIMAGLPAGVRGIIVMAPQSLSEVREAVERIEPWGVQLHGREGTDLVKEVREDLSCRVIKALHVAGERTLEEALEHSKVCDAILLDTPAEGLGGSGAVHDWRISRKIRESLQSPVFLAGGLNPENVSEAIREVGPYCVDTSSGVEARPGKKDPEKVRRFIEGAKAAAQPL
ncbi:MAG: phosphoribosylanthranilate isomerase [Methanobacteriota archaeon]|nr:MAG: phosphoribosylanthranilate isomerase [Euryarchaeota archaeon]